MKKIKEKVPHLHSPMILGILILGLVVTSEAGDWTGLSVPRSEARRPRSAPWSPSVLRPGVPPAGAGSKTRGNLRHSSSQEVAGAPVLLMTSLVTCVSSSAARARHSGVPLAATQLAWLQSEDSKALNNITLKI